MRAASSIVVLALALAGFGATSCGRGRPAARPAEDASARAQALIEAGNEAYRAGDYALAAKRYGAAAVARKDDPAAYFGMGMALTRLGRHDEARVAYARSRELARQARMPSGPEAHP
jgi:Flp pilus assembly protein TadD